MARESRESLGPQAAEGAGALGQASLEAFFRVRPPQVRDLLRQVRKLLLLKGFGMQECWKWRTAFYKCKTNVCYLSVRIECDVLVGFIWGSELSSESLFADKAQKQIRLFHFDGSQASVKELKSILRQALKKDEAKG